MYCCLFHYQKTFLTMFLSPPREHHIQYSYCVLFTEWDRAVFCLASTNEAGHDVKSVPSGANFTPWLLSQHLQDLESISLVHGKSKWVRWMQHMWKIEIPLECRPLRLAMTWNLLAFGANFTSWLLSQHLQDLESNWLGHGGSTFV